MSKISSIESIIRDARKGKMFILVDDEDRENEGDLVIPAEKANAAAINFMAKHGRGLICLALDKQRVEQLKLPLMSQHNQTRHTTAFTISIEAREGVTTGISAGDRARTIAVAIDPKKSAQDIISPGHVFPLVAREGGVLVRAGHTEAAVDIARLAGLNSSGVICEIMKDDGEMARLPDLLTFAKKHKLKVATIADLIAYRRRSEKLIKREVETKFKSKFGGEFRLVVYVNTVEYAEHIALVKGKIDPKKPTLVRMHAVDPLSDILGDLESGSTGTLHKAMKRIAKKGNGVIVLLRQSRRDSLSEKLKKRLGQQTADGKQLRDYGVGAQILLDLGVKKMTLLAHATPDPVGLEGYGLTITSTEKI